MSPGNHHSTSCLCESDIPGTLHQRDHTERLFVLARFPWHRVFKAPVLRHVSALHSFSRPNNVPLDAYAPRLFIHSFISDSFLPFVVTVNNAINEHRCIYLSPCSQFFWVYIPRSGIAGPYGNSMFNFLRNHHSFHSSCTILDSHQMCTSFPFFTSLLFCQHSFCLKKQHYNSHPNGC